MKQIWTLTMNPAIDIGSTVDKVEPKKKLRCDDLRIEPGGGGVNVARALRKLDADVTAVFPSKGHLGKFYGSLLEKESVNFQTFETEQDFQRINNNVREKSKNRQFRFCTPGTDMEDGWKKALSLLEDALDEDSILVVSGSRPSGVPDDFNVRVAGLAEEKNSILILDTSEELLGKLEEAEITWITPNLQELKAITGKDIERDDLEQEIERIVKDTPIRNVLLTMGSEGALYAGQYGRFCIEAPDVEKVSAVGAGDSAVAGLAYGLAKGMSHKEAVLCSVAAGTAAVMTPASNLLEKDDFLDIVNSMKDHV